MKTTQKVIIGIPIAAIITYFYLLPLASTLILSSLHIFGHHCHTDFPQTEVEVQAIENQNNTTTITANWTKKSNKDYPQVIEKLTLRHDHRAEQIKVIKIYENSQGRGRMEKITLEKYGQKKTTVINATVNEPHSEVTANEIDPIVIRKIYGEHGNKEERQGQGCFGEFIHDPHVF